MDRGGDRAADLSGTWKASPADETLRRSYLDDDFDDSGWDDLEVPCHWQSNPAFADVDGPVLHRRWFETDALLATTGDPERAASERVWLVLDGAFYTTDVWLDGSYVGDTEGYFFPHQFEVTDLVAARSEHLLAIEVACAPPLDLRRKRNLTGVFQHWDLKDQRWNPGGIWRPVRLERSGEVRIRHLRTLCTEATDDGATVFVRAVLDTVQAHTVGLRTTLTSPDGREVVVDRDHVLAAGENRLEWTIAVTEPALWWPWSLGDQPRYDVTVEVVVDGAVSDRRHRAIGLRSVELDNWIFSINGERMFLKGSNQGPTRMDLAEATRDDFVRDLQLAKDAGLDLLRMHAHVSKPELYDAADEMGMLLWQDLPLQWGYARSVRRQARRQAREAVDLLGHHPSVVIWCGHNEPMAIDVQPDALADPRRKAGLLARAAASQLLPTWNKSVLDHSIASVLSKDDGSRPVIPHSGVFPHPPQLDGTDTHLYFGWYHGHERELPKALRWWPRLARFVTEFGAQAVPEDCSFLEPERWPDLDWDRAYERHSLQKLFFDQHVPPARYPTFEAWRDATQRYQAELVRRQVETLRLLKYRPCGGFAQFCFADGYPSVTWSVLGHDRQPKLGYHALRDACAAVAIIAGRPPATLPAGSPLRVEVYAVSDLRIVLRDMVAHVHLHWSQHGAEKRLGWGWRGDLPADACVRIGRVDTVVPPADGSVRIDLQLTRPDGGVEATNSYTVEVR